MNNLEALHKLLDIEIDRFGILHDSPLQDCFLGVLSVQVSEPIWRGSLWDAWRIEHPGEPFPHEIFVEVPHAKA